MKLKTLFNRKFLLLIKSNNFLLIYIIVNCLFFAISPIRAQKNIIEIEEILNSLEKGYINYSFECIKKLSIKNDINAQFYLAECYYYGICTEKNLAESFKLYRKAAERGLPDAMNKLIIFYKEGELFTPDQQKSKEWSDRFKKKGGKNILPDIQPIFKEGLQHPENFALNPIKINSSILSNDEDPKLSYTTSSTSINNITIISSSGIQYKDQQNVYTLEKGSYLDYDIPVGNHTHQNTFALIIANEDYHDVAGVPNAINDGEIFAQYCNKTLGIPEENIHLVKNATLNNIKRELNLMNQIAEAFSGEASFIIYYAGHGIPDEATGDSYILPVDGYPSDISTGYSLTEFYAKLSNFPTQKTLVFIDACFSGSLRGDGMLQAARGVALKAKPTNPKGKMVVFSAAQGDETAYPLEKEKHGLFTYWLLKSIQETKGNISLGDLSEYIITNVGKQSLVINGKKQTPSVQVSPSIQDNWREWNLSQ